MDSTSFGQMCYCPKEKGSTFVSDFFPSSFSTDQQTSQDETPVAGFIVMGKRKARQVKVRSAARQISQARGWQGRTGHGRENQSSQGKARNGKLVKPEQGKAGQGTELI